jgi:hypothetical protein
MMTSLKLNKIALGIGILASVVSVVLIYLSVNGYMNSNGNMISIFMGFGLPFFGGMFFKRLGGCGIKDEGCPATSMVGFFLGLIALVIIYYFLTVLILKVLKVNSKN